MELNTQLKSLWNEIQISRGYRRIYNNLKIERDTVHATWK